MTETALITGASGGLGEEFARLCAAQGMNLILVARSKDKLKTLADELKQEHGIRTYVIAADLSHPSGVDDVVQQTDATGLAVTLLINNAGFGTYGLFVQGDTDDQTNMLMLNIVTLTHLTRAILPGMIQRQHGKILNIASTAAFQPGPLMNIYYATKAYVLNFSLALSNETTRNGVSVTCLCPGPTKTGFAQHANVVKTRLFTLGVMDARTVALIGLNALQKGKPLVVAGIRNKIGVFMTRFIPRMLAAAIARSVQSPLSS